MSSYDSDEEYDDGRGVWLWGLLWGTYAVGAMVCPLAAGFAAAKGALGVSTKWAAAGLVCAASGMYSQSKTQQAIRIEKRKFKKNLKKLT
jgi:hypothetical protein